MTQLAVEKVHPYREVFERYVDDAAFLWVLRDQAVEQFNYNLDDVIELEQRIDAQLDGLISAPSLAWELCEQALSFEEAGEVFCAAIIAFTSLDVEKIQQVVEVALEQDAAYKGLVSAMAWLPGKFIHSWVKKFFTSKDMAHKALAVAVCSARREDPAAYLTAILQREDCLADESLHWRCLKLIGQLKRRDQIDALLNGLSHENPKIQFWAAWSLTLLGEAKGREALQTFVFNEGEFQNKAIDLIFKCLEHSAARQLIAKLGQDKNQIASVIRASAVLGDPQAISWLIRLMHDPKLARKAAAAFTVITGVDLVSNQLSVDAPINDEVSTDDHNEDDIALDEDEFLPWPAAEQVALAWQSWQGRFSPGQRYFMGRVVEPEQVKQSLKNSAQPLRELAALELALLQPQQYLINVKAYGGGLQP